MPAVLAAVRRPRARRGIQHRDREHGAVRGPGRRPVLAGDRRMGRRRGPGHRDVPGATSVMPCESTFRRTLRQLDADAQACAADGR